MKMLIIYKKHGALIACKCGINSGNVGCVVYSFRASYLTSVGCEVKSECVPEEMVYVFDEISLTLNPELVCHDKKTC